MRGRYLRKKWQNRAKNEVRLRAWPLRLAHHFVFCCAPEQLLLRTILSFAAHQSNFCCAPFCLLLRTRATFAAHHFVLCCAAKQLLLRTNPDVSSAIIAYPGKSLPAFFTIQEIYFHLCLLALTDIWDNLSRIFRDKGEIGGICKTR